MKISTKGRYALRMMVDLAGHRDEGVVALKDIAARQNISKKYLEQIVPLLNRAELLRTIRGYQGGYALSKPPEEYTVREILQVTEGNLAPVACLQSNNDCEMRNTCPTLHVWDGLNKVINEYLDGITLADLVNTPDNGGDYCI